MNGSLRGARTDLGSNRPSSSTEDQLHDTAVRTAGFDNFGDVTYRLGLRALLEALEIDCLLTEADWRSVHRLLRNVLVGRLYACHGWAQHPNVLSLPIRRPLFIAGLPRTGTTALHRLLCVDPQFQGPELWISCRPMIRPDRQDWDAHPEYRDLAASLAEASENSPASRTIHESAANEVEECFYILMQTFFSHNWGPSLPTYAKWLGTQDLKPSYHYYANVLRLIGAREPDRIWLLKYPLHMMEIDSLLDVFPDARIIQTHRDPLESIPSWYSLYQSGDQDSARPWSRSRCLGQSLLYYARQSHDRMDAARARCPDRFIDVDFRRLLDDPLCVVREVYERFNLTLRPKVEQMMQAWIVTRPRSKHGKHEYVLHDFNVTTDQMLGTFADYRARHGFVKP